MFYLLFINFKKFGLERNYPSLKKLDKILEEDYNNIVYLVLDCLGKNILKIHQDDAKFLNSHLITNVTSF